MPSSPIPEPRRRGLPFAGAAVLIAGLAIVRPGPGQAGPAQTGSEPVRDPIRASQAGAPEKPPARAAGDPPNDGDGAEEGEGEGQPAGRLGRLGDLIAEGKVNRGLIHPVFEKGRLSSVLSAETMTRRNAENLDIEGMRIELYNEPDGGRSFTIDLRTAVYHLMTDQLSSEDETVIEGKGFVLVGERMVFDTRTGVGRLMGAVKMTISDAASLALAGDGEDGDAVASPPTDGADGESANDESEADDGNDDAQ